jgi:hypothetical protein
VRLFLHLVLLVLTPSSSLVSCDRQCLASTRLVELRCALNGALHGFLSNLLEAWLAVSTL